MKPLRLSLLCLVLSLALSASSATYFCSPSGNGNGSTYGNPCSLSNGIKMLQSAGDTLYLLGGTYYIGKTTISDKNGSSTCNIVISGYPGEKAILDFRQTAYGTRGLQVNNSCTYLHIRNLTLCYSGKNNLYNEGSYCTFENLDIYGSADTGCQMKNGGGNIIKNVDSHHNFDYGNTSGDDLTFDNIDYGGNADGFADKQHTGASNHYIGCRAWCNSDDGWDFFQRNNSSCTTPTIIENCICYQNGPKEYDMRNHPRYETDQAFFDAFKKGKICTDRNGNTVTITLEHFTNIGNGNGFKLGGGYTPHNVLLHHCLAVGNTVKGFDQNNDDGQMSLYNCTSYLNGNNYGFTTAYGSNILVNCVSLSSRNADSYKSKSVIRNEYNSWNIKGVQCNASDFVSLDTTQILAARQADGSLTGGTLLRLKSGSDLIDAGVDVGYSYRGKAPDLGCYEYPEGETHEGSGDPTKVDPTGNDTVSGQGHHIAYVTIPGSTEDKALLSYLRAYEALSVYVTDANDNSVDYSDYELIILGAKPSSGAVGFVPLKGYNKPAVLLKPFLLKNTVWNWGTAVNTQDLSIQVDDATHSIFAGLTIDAKKQVQLFSQCQTNAVTAISTWTNTEVTKLAAPVSNTDNTTVAYIESGTNCNGTQLKAPMIMIGLSEYSTAYLTADGLRLVRNAIAHLLGITISDITSLNIAPRTQTVQKQWTSQGLVIRVGEHTYNTLGQIIQ